MGPHAQIISVSTISAAHARILLVPLQLIPQTVALVKDVLFHEITSYNIVTVEGAAASRVFFHLKAEAVRMGE